MMTKAVKTNRKASRFVVTKEIGAVSALLVRPPDPRGLLVFGHGAGAGMRHAFMETAAEVLAQHGVATFRYQFPYMERDSKRPDSPAVLAATVRSAIAAAAKLSEGRLLLAGGKSMGGRITSLVMAASDETPVHGLVFFGFPLHAAGKPSIDRASHLADITVPMLFLQGTRDPLADLELFRPLCRRLGRRTVLHIVEGGDHSFHVPIRTGRTDRDVLDELGQIVSTWVSKLT